MTTLPARRTNVAIGPAPAVAEEAAALWKASWSDISKLNERDLHHVAAVITSSFPHMGALEVTSYFDLLGGKLRPTGEFWLHVAAQHPQTEWGPELEAIQHGTPAWGEWLDEELAPDLVAAAYVATLKRRDRTTPIVEANYVLRSDSILWEYQWLNDLPAKSRQEAAAQAQELAGPGGEVDRVTQKDGGYHARVRRLRPDWRPLAKKKARTTAARRVCRRAFSLVEARVLSTLAAAQRVLDQANGDGAGDIDAYLVERDRRRLHAWAAERDVGDREPHEVLKEIIADVQGVPLDQVSTKRVTYRELEQIRERLERFPYRDAAGVAES